MFALVTRLYQQSPADAAADRVIAERLARCNGLLNPWLNSMNHFGIGLETLHEEGI